MKTLKQLILDTLGEIAQNNSQINLNSEAAQEQIADKLNDEVTNYLQKDCFGGIAVNNGDEV